MDTHVKERLIGAGILVALIVVLVPEILSGSRQTTGSRAVDILPGAPNNSGAVRTYTIDLSTPEAPAEAPPQQAPQLPETPVETPEPVVPAVREAPAIQAERLKLDASKPEVLKPEIVNPASSAPPTTKPTPRSSPAEPAPSADIAGWAVQLGSFANRGNAERLVKELSAHGYKAFMSSSGSGAKARYKVRVGPEQDRARADDLAQRLKRDGRQVAVIAYP